MLRTSFFVLICVEELLYFDRESENASVLKIYFFLECGKRAENEEAEVGQNTRNMTPPGVYNYNIHRCTI